MNMMLAARMDVDRSRDMARVLEGNAFLQKVMQLGTDSVKVLDASGTVCFMNDLGLSLMEIDDFSAIDGVPWVSLWPEFERERIAGAIAAALMGETMRLDAYRPTLKGVPKWWDVTVAPLDTTENAEPILIAISHDITARMEEIDALRRELKAKDDELAEKDLVMHEVHHRAKNSLQLVQGLLGIQSRAAGTDPVAAAQLMQSSSRVRTIAALHDHLYRTRAALEVEVKPYLMSLVNDMESDLATSLSGRRISFQADDARWTANDIPALGLVLTELMHNAVKYGAGDIAVSFRQPAGGQPLLTVTDHGGALPADFDPAASKGLGMKLITSLLRERNGGGLEFSSRDGVTTFVACMPRPAVSSAVAAST